MQNAPPLTEICVRNKLDIKFIELKIKLESILKVSDVCSNLLPNIEFQKK